MIVAVTGGSNRALQGRRQDSQEVYVEGPEEQPGEDGLEESQLDGAEQDATNLDTWQQPTVSQVNT